MLTVAHLPQSLDAGSVAALPEGLRVELESIEDAGGVRFLQEMAAQIRVRGSSPSHPRLTQHTPPTHETDKDPCRGLICHAPKYPPYLQSRLIMAVCLRGGLSPGMLCLACQCPSVT